jgi:hypothetical protein
MAKVSSLAELVECAVCKEELKDARILACHHSFCLQCINEVINKSSAPAAISIPCPTCRQTTSFPHGGPNRLPVDFRLAQMKQAMSLAQTAPSTSQTGSSTEGPSVSEVEHTPEKGRFCDVCSAIRGCKRACTTAVAFCNQCTFLFCTKCLVEHGKSKLTSSHAVTRLLEEGSGSVSTCKLPTILLTTSV